ncbi:GGDEF domain-containing protein [Pseudomaricurvus alkylphenolicus]|uniref:GGDEF domain-containing protein n=1 Tax=Pseudomaricurvus alkylphenolicus TaxID=1306991 RepID=UPI00142247B0|nr:GGDEF domain-containing protein [Pseudomaricurvus alkylphenolicus]NIB39954.1 GGDEF domain-containing protein [Pseudomaricurvus alkylphenolicus]
MQSQPQLNTPAEAHLHELKLNQILEKKLEAASTRLLESGAYSLHVDLETICRDFSASEPFELMLIELNYRDFHLTCGEMGGTPSDPQARDASAPIRDQEHHYGVIRCRWIADNEHEILLSSLQVSIANLIAATAKRIELEQKLERLTREDTLTRLNNRGQFIRLCDSEVERGLRYGHNAALLMMDIDNFKLINDHYGHDMGDRVLQELGRILIETVRPSDLLGRLGGEEFALFLPETSLSAAMETAERIRQLVEDSPIAVEDKLLSITLSLGVCPLDHSAEDPMQQALEMADQGLYDAKQQGRNRVCSVCV